MVTSRLEVFGLLLKSNVLQFEQHLVCGDKTGVHMFGVLTFIAKLLNISCHTREIGLIFSEAL